MGRIFSGNIAEVIVPVANDVDLDDVPTTVRDDLTIHLVSHVDEVLDLALGTGAEADSG